MLTDAEKQDRAQALADARPPSARPPWTTIPIFCIVGVISIAVMLLGLGTAIYLVTQFIEILSGGK